MDANHSTRHHLEQPLMAEVNNQFMHSVMMDRNMSEGVPATYGSRDGYSEITNSSMSPGNLPSPSIANVTNVSNPRQAHLLQSPSPDQQHYDFNQSMLRQYQERLILQQLNRNPRDVSQQHRDYRQTNLEQSSFEEAASPNVIQQTSMNRTTQANLQLSRPAASFHPHSQSSTEDRDLVQDTVKIQLSSGESSSQDNLPPQEYIVPDAEITGPHVEGIDPLSSTQGRNPVTCITTKHTNDIPNSIQGESHNYHGIAQHCLEDQEKHPPSSKSQIVADVGKASPTDQQPMNYLVSSPSGKGLCDSSTASNLEQQHSPNDDYTAIPSPFTYNHIEYTMDSCKSVILAMLKQLTVENTKLKDKVVELEKKVLKYQEGMELLGEIQAAKEQNRKLQETSCDRQTDPTVTIETKHSSEMSNNGTQYTDAPSDQSADSEGSGTIASPNESRHPTLRSRRTVSRVVKNGRKTKTKKTHSCSECGKTCTYISGLTRHVISAHSNVLPCHTCGQIFQNEDDHNEHAAETHEGETCNTCGKSFRCGNLFRKHVEKCQPDKKGNEGYNDEINKVAEEVNGKVNIISETLCSMCNESFPNVESLENHQCSHVDMKEKNRCTVCGIQFASQPVLRLHTMIHTGEKPHVCSHCGKQFRTRGDFRYHMMVHSGERPFPCKVCDKAYITRSRLKQHMLKHTGSSRFSCDRCDKSFSKLQGLQIHTRRDHEGIKFQKCCEICGKAFSNLKVHMLTHTREKPYRCTVCDRGFRNNISCKEHLLTHTGEKPHCCATCGKTFTRASELKLHTRTHTGEKPYPCLVCNQRFSSSSQVSAHRHIHTGAKPFSCQTCGKQFRQRSVLKNHLLVHTGERPYICTLCDKRFVQSAHRNTHLKLVHGQKKQ